MLFFGAPINRAIGIGLVAFALMMFYVLVFDRGSDEEALLARNLASLVGKKISRVAYLFFALAVLIFGALITLGIIHE